jgi:hypothetical protein
MGFPLNLDEYTEEQLAAELERRKQAHAAGLCDYCKRPPSEPPCKFPERHAVRPPMYPPCTCAVGFWCATCPLHGMGTL